MKINFTLNLETGVPEYGEAPSTVQGVKFLQSLKIWGAMSSVGAAQSTVNTAIYQEIHFMLPSANMLYGDANFLSQQDLALAHSAKTTTKWFADHVIDVFDCPANSSDVSPRELSKKQVRKT